MAGYAVIGIEGVLARVADGALITSQPIPAGVTLYATLRRNYKIALLAYERNEAKIVHWLRSNHVTDYTTLLAGGPGLPVDQRAAQIRELRLRGYALDLVIDASPAVVAKAMHAGVTSLLFASPKYARPEFRPDAPRGIREWADIEGEMDLQREFRAQEPARTADLYE